MIAIKKNKPGITHVLLPIEVAFNDELKYSDKIVWWVINILDTTQKHCFASNKYIAKRARYTERIVINSIAKLIKLGYIKRSFYEDENLTKNRVLKVEKNLEKFRSILTKYNDW